MANLHGTTSDAFSNQMSAPPRQLEFSVLPGQFVVARLAPNAPLPSWATQGWFFSITCTNDELSIVCAADEVPPAFRDRLRWRAFKVRGPMALSEVGILASLATPLAEANISVFVISTFETDYLLVNSEQVRQAIEALHKAGHKICEANAAS
jgi:uncharacterized protein